MEMGGDRSCAYTLVTDIQSMLADCDLDVLIRCPTRHKKEDFAEFAIKANTPLCRIDIHVETPKVVSLWQNGLKTKKSRFIRRMAMS